MKKTQIEKYKRRYLRIKKHFEGSELLKNPHFNRLLWAADRHIKIINQKSLAEETKLLTKNQLDLILSTLETKLKE
ncbi:MAG: hypothetical protein MK008_06360 [Bdellovibrionales bacterium]|nr:hypothetical protein [Bdellovibrionales bacterium]